MPPSSKSIARRAVFYIGGYDPKSAGAFFARLDRETTRFSGLWGVNAGAKGKISETQHLARRAYHAKGVGWSCETDFNFVALDDIVLTDFARPVHKRLGRYMVTASDYVLTGTAFAFFRHAWRFALYFLYPLFMLILATLVAFTAGWLVAMSRESLIIGTLAGAVAAIAVFWAATRFLFPRTYVLHLMDLWSFSRDFVHRSRADIDVKLDRVAQTAAKAARSGTYDEIIFIGHSTGGGLILSLAARTRNRLGDTHHASSLVILTVGSTALKIGLHPGAGWFRKEVAALTADPAWDWSEFQALPDIINFYKTDPAALMGAGGHGKPVVNAVRMKAMVDPATYKRMKGNFFRMHYQFVFGNSKRYWYDFPAICFGPAPLMDRANNRSAFAESLFPETS